MGWYKLSFDLRLLLNNFWLHEYEMDEVRLRLETQTKICLVPCDLATPCSILLMRIFLKKLSFCLALC